MSASSGQPDILQLARHLWGERNAAKSTPSDVRFGTNGSKSVRPKERTWYDHEANEGGGYLDLYQKAYGESPVTDQSIAAAYDYLSPTGALLYQVVRKVPKNFLQRRPDGNGGWIWKMAGVVRVPYRLPELVAADSGIPVFICEGEKDCDALAARGFVTTTNPGGAGKWLPNMSPYLRGRDAIILPDNDQPGEDHALDVAAKLHGIARTVTIHRLPGLPPKGDVSDWLAHGGDVDELSQIAIQQASPSSFLLEDALPPEIDDPGYYAAVETEAPTNIIDNRPSILVIAGRVDLIATSGESALMHSQIEVYQRGRELVRPVQQEVPASKGRMTISAGMAKVAHSGMIDLLSQAADWKKFDGRKKTEVATDPPAMVADIILSRIGQWKLPTVAGVITTPTIRPDGTILYKPGYDPMTRLFQVVDPSLVPSYIPDRPTRQDAEAALKILDSLLDEFPFVNDVHRSVALSAIITPVVRGAVPVAPLHAFRASTAGSGKSYLVDTASAVVTGRPCPVVAVSPKPEETESRLIGLLLAAFPLISLDNVNGELGGDLLCQAVERPTIRVRRLGGSDIFEIESRATFYATGNGLRVKGDMTRRTLTCDLDTGLERPEQRKFTHSPVDDVLADRGKYVAAALTLVRAYIVAGYPDKLTPLASFEEWSDLVRSPLVWLGLKDPVQTTEEAREDDPELISIREIILRWSEVMGTGVFNTVKEVVAKANERTQTVMGEPTELVASEFRDALVSVAGFRGDINNQKLSNWLLSKKGRIINAMRIKRGDNDPHTKGTTWGIDNA